MEVQDSMGLTDDEKTDVALFRFSLIAPLLNNQVADPRAYLEDVASKVWDVPHYGKKEYNFRTIQHWLSDYRKHNIDGLKPQPRSDRGSSRVITEELGGLIIDHRQENRHLSVMLFYDLLAKEGVLLRSWVSYHSVYRFLKARNLARPDLDDAPVKDRRRFAFDEVNRLWQGDMMVGPKVLSGGKKRQSFLFAFLDDCSRIFTHACFVLEQNLDTMKRVYIEAVLRRGLPQVVYLDNAKVYRSQLFHAACARMGTTVAHAEVYDASSKGKIERAFRTVRERFLVLLPEPVASLDELNKLFWKWLEEDYHRRVHSSLGMSPLDKYLSQIQKVRTADDPEAVWKLFMRREQRRVKSDATISILGKTFEVPSALIGKRVEVRFDDFLDDVLLYEGDTPAGRGKPVILADNALVRREKYRDKDVQPISFHEALRRKEEG
jgi:transposase InsO family protein